MPTAIVKGAAVHGRWVAARINQITLLKSAVLKGLAIHLQSFTNEGFAVECVKILFQSVQSNKLSTTSRKVADRVGFEPTVRFHARWFSRPVPSTTRPPVPLPCLCAIGEINSRGFCGFLYLWHKCVSVFDGIALIYIPLTAICGYAQPSRERCIRIGRLFAV